MTKLTLKQALEIVDKAPMRTEFAQFGCKQAYISEVVKIDGKSYVLFKSYRTIVALVDIENEVVYRLGKWSSTTSKQTTQFCNQYYRSFEQVQF